MIQNNTTTETVEKIPQSLDGKISIEFTQLELHILTKALSEYNRISYRLTNNIHHANATEELYYKISDIYCNS